MSTKWCPLKPQMSPVPFVVNGKTLSATIEASYAYDEDSVDGSFDFGDEAENAKYLARFERGELGNFVVRVVARCLGTEGSDYLGGCHAANDDDLSLIVREHGMVNSAIVELSKTLLDIYNGIVSRDTK